MSVIDGKDARQELIYHGIDWVLPEIPDMIRRARLELGTNDILLTLVMGDEDDEVESVSSFHAKREDGIAALEGLFRESGHDPTIDFLKSVTPDPETGLVVLIQGMTVFSWRHRLDDLKTLSMLS